MKVYVVCVDYAYEGYEAPVGVYYEKADADRKAASVTDNAYGMGPVGEVFEMEVE